MTKFDRARFEKLLALAESSNDHEALLALRKATAICRGARMSLGEAIRTKSGPAIEIIDSGAFERGFEMGKIAGEIETRRELEPLLKAAENRLARKESRDEALRRARADGYREGVRAGRAEFTDRDEYQAGHRAGYEKGLDDSLSAINRAYDRGLKDGLARVDPAAAPKARRKSKTSR